MVDRKVKGVLGLLGVYFFKNRVLFFVVVLLTVLVGFCYSVTSVFFGKSIDVLAESLHSFQSYYKYLIYLFLFLLLSFIIDFSKRYLKASLVTKVGFQMRIDYIKKFLFLPILNSEKIGTNKFFSAIINDLYEINYDCVSEGLNLFLDVSKAVFSLLTALYLNATLAIVFLSTSVFVVIFSHFYSSKRKKLNLELSDKIEVLSTSVKNIVSGSDVLKNYDRASYAVSSIKSSLRSYLSVKKRSLNLSSVYTSFEYFFIDFMGFIAVVISGVLYLKGITSLSTLASSLILSALVFNPISNIFETVSYLRSGDKVIKKIYSFFEVKESSESKHISFKINEDWNEISIRDLQLKYDDNVVLNNFNLSVKRGDKILLVGDSGSGKSTLLKILSGYTDEYIGSIEIDGKPYIPYESYDLGFFRYLPQDAIIFNDTIENNITLGDKSESNESLETVLRKAQLDKLKAERDFKEVIKEDSVTLSGGEKQRVCFARLLYRGSQVYLIDEVTSSLDEETSKEIEKMLFSLEETIIYVSHKPTEYALSGATKIINIEKTRD